MDRPTAGSVQALTDTSITAAMQRYRHTAWSTDRSTAGQVSFDLFDTR